MPNYNNREALTVCKHWQPYNHLWVRFPVYHYALLYLLPVMLVALLVFEVIFKGVFRCLHILRVSNVKNQHLQNNLLTAVICWTNSHLNTAAVAVNSIAFLGWKLIKICENMTLRAVTPGNDDILSQYCTSIFPCEQTFIKKCWWFDWWSMITIVASLRQDFKPKNWGFCPQRPHEW